MMLQAFLKERRSWILFFLSLQLLILFVAYLDTTIPIASLFYIVLLSTFLMIVFLFFRYRKETAYYERLKEWDDDIEHQMRLTPLPHLSSSSMMRRQSKLHATGGWQQSRKSLLKKKKMNCSLGYMRSKHRLQRCV